MWLLLVRHSTFAKALDTHVVIPGDLRSFVVSTVPKPG
jgi:hypothetical protein